MSKDKKAAKLTTDQMTVIANEVILGKPVSIKEPAAEVATFAKGIKKDKAEAAKNGWVLEVPFEIEVA